MFRAPITRPLRWAIPLAIAGAVLALGLLSLGMTRGQTDCASVLAHLTGEGDGPVGFRVLPDRGTPDALPELPTLRDVGASTAECADARRGRAALALGLAALALLPLAVFAVRGFLWGADTLHELERRVPPAPERGEPKAPDA